MRADEHGARAKSRRHPLANRSPAKLRSGDRSRRPPFKLHPFTPDAQRLLSGRAPDSGRRAPRCIFPQPPQDAAFLPGDRLHGDVGLP
eukprot:scaffold3326_cov116-Isochrysis_galbana.AAC.3